MNLPGGPLQDSDLLLTIAEVAVAFAGFASLVGILGQRSSRDDPRVLGVRMRGMILFSLLAVTFSLIPFAFHRYGLEEAWIWRASSALLSLSFLAVGVWILRSISRLMLLDIRRPPWAIAVVLLLAITAGVVLPGSSALLGAPVFVAAAYISGLMLHLFLAGFAFCLIVFSFLPSLDAE